MEPFNIGRFSAQQSNNRILHPNKIGGANSQPLAQSTQQQTQMSFVRTFHIQQNIPQLRMNYLASIDRSIYIKDLLALPKDMNELIKLVRNMANTNSSTTQTNISKMVQSGNLAIADIAVLLQQNAKEASNKLILAMAQASKQGISDLSQIKETLSILNASVSAADPNNTTQAIKSLMLLYLPWLPLDEGVGFDLEVEPQETDGANADSILTILVKTKNYGNIKAILALSTSNSVDIIITCAENFPKNELLKQLKEDEKKHAVQSNIEINTMKTMNLEDKQQVKIDMSSTNQINPFLLLMAHSFIRHTIEIDTKASIGE